MAGLYGLQRLGMEPHRKLEYAKQAGKLNVPVLYVNSVCLDQADACGAARGGAALVDIMSAFITNFQSPVEMQDLEDRFRRGGISNLNMLLHWRQFQPLEWTVDKQAVVGDTVLFMCAKTSVDHIGRLYTQIRKAGQKDSALGRFAAAQQALYKKYAGCIVAFGRVAKEPFQTEAPGWDAPYWRSPWYAEIDHILLLDMPIHISQFRDFITVSRTGAITRLNTEQWAKLRTLIANMSSVL